MRRGDDAVRHPGVVEGQHGLVVHQQVAAPGPLLQRLDLGPQRLVGREEGVPGPPLSLDQRGAEEDLPRLGRVDPAVADPAPGHDRHAEQADRLVRQHRPAAGGPVRLGVLPLEQVLADLLHLLGGDPGDRTRPQPAGLDQLGGDHQRGRRPGQAGPGTDREPGATGPEVLLQTGSAAPAATGAAGPARVGRRGRPGRAARPAPRCAPGPASPGRRCGPGPARGDLLELAVQVLPLPDPQEVQELVPAQPAERVAGQGLALGPQVVPQVQPGHEVGGVAAPELVEGLGIWPFDRLRAHDSASRTGGAGRRPAPGLGRALPRVDDGQAGDDDQHLPQAALALGLDAASGPAGDPPGARPAAARPSVSRGCVARPGSASAPSSVEQPQAVGDLGAVGRPRRTGSRRSPRAGRRPSAGSPTPGWSAGSPAR